MVREGEAETIENDKIIIMIMIMIRLIVDMSFPHHRKEDVKVFGSVPLSCNASIDMDLFPAQMTTTGEVVEKMLRFGGKVHFCKQDWTGEEVRGPGRITIENKIF